MYTSLGIATISGSVMRSVSASLSEYLLPTSPYSGNLNIRSRRQRQLYNRLVSGDATFGQTDQTIPSGMSAGAPAFAPSWTQYYIGKRHGFVAAALSSSQESRDLNLYASSSIPLEQSPVPASGTLFYEKNNRFIWVRHSLTASVGLTIFDTSGKQVSSSFDAVSGSIFKIPTGSLLFPIRIPEYGRIRDIRVWVELIDIDRVTPDPSERETGFGGFLGCLTLGLRSPNVNFFSGIPLYNSDNLQKFFLSTNQLPVPALNADWLRNQYPMWIGTSRFFTLDPPFSASYSGWNDDRDMRCIFTDSAPKSTNPFLLNPLYNDASFSSSLGPPFFLSGNSPNYVGITTYGTTASFATPTHTGNFYPWFIDGRIGIGNLITAANTSYTSSVVPPGWLTGPVVGGVPTANPGEFPTSTSGNLGPNFVFPVFGFLDDVFQETLYLDPLQSFVTVEGTDFTKNKYIGTRPGLRGTEINGTWNLVLNLSQPFPVGLGFRQFRLEFLIDQNYGMQWKSHLSRKYCYDTPATVKKRFGGKNVIGIVSGSGIVQDEGTQLIYTVPQEQYGRSIGITDNTGSSPDFAVFSRMTGALSDMLFASASLSSSGTAHAIYSYLNNPNGTPFIPISSGSSLAPSFQSFNSEDLPTKVIISEIINPRPLLAQAQNLRSTLSRLSPAKKAADAVVQKLLDIRKTSLL